MTSKEDLFTESRLEEIDDLRSKGINPYPHKFNVTTSFKDYITKYSKVENGSRHHEFPESVAGRIKEKRNAGKNLCFITFESNGDRLQVIFDRREYINHLENKTIEPYEFKELCNRFHRGDIIGINGFAGKSIKGELSIYALDIVLLTPCFKFLPKDTYGLKDVDMRVQKRYLDLIANRDSRDVFVTRSKIIKEIRNYLDAKDFMEVSTPILSSQAGGAAAKPFITHHNDLDQEMYMRVAPELFLKKLVVGGLDRVYEIGPQFRNESIDTTHLPEFTSLEFYLAYADYNDLMNMTEEMLYNIVTNINSKPQIEYNVTDDKQVTIDFTPPYKRIDMIPELEKYLGKLPEDFSTEQSRNLLDKLCQDNSVDCSHPRTSGRLLDKLVGHFIEPQCINPTFIINHPVVMSPLAKQHRDNPQLTERFELFVNKFEISNAFTELNSHTIQKERFEQQQKDKQDGDIESMPKDDEFIEALKYGLPPTAGYGMGIDRLTMILTNRDSIRDVILFPTVATKND